MCSKKAEWTIIHGAAPDDCTEACTEHVGDLLTDAVEHRVYRIFDEPANRAEARCCFIEEAFTREEVGNPRKCENCGRAIPKPKRPSRSGHGSFFELFERSLRRSLLGSQTALPRLIEGRLDDNRGPRTII